LRLSFGAGTAKSANHLQAMIQEQIMAYEDQWEMKNPFKDNTSRLKRLIQHMHQQSGQRVVILVDEYDKPILDNLTQAELARNMRDALRSLYSVFKDSDAHVKFVFITGVSKFSKVSLFSGLNNLKDITLDPRFSALLV
jgi:hypothetical protein